MTNEAKKLKLTTKDGELDPEYLARIALLDEIVGEYSPKKCLTDKD